MVAREALTPAQSEGSEDITPPWDCDVPVMLRQVVRQTTPDTYRGSFPGPLGGPRGRPAPISVVLEDQTLASDTFRSRDRRFRPRNGSQFPS